ncbi:hypothetical protein CL6EHI_065880 [Entamoeba histolytica]|uniref:Uncharacterized protein n=2 Tax=Entamoeba histolytica TaxID=5759 RepID=C4M004_ENTH1|nr:hypothetical protein EHI_065880 [Entamoeba histolytica HM-1:IMSS]EAL48279.1 hypothetical protein EHI_065880 [Entamoeba histolytica HM-1:IMSS]GAT94467.1 hypothetical protein CL6EHI_065880 [Entamoeba histolytica]|eukprot:XP_653665.1 hypothetical protein EHI_065880 [Entamoeba histolytica HM-1:IMSS]
MTWFISVSLLFIVCNAMEIHQFVINKGKHLYPIQLQDNETIQIFHTERLYEEIKVYKTTHEIYIESPITLKAEYSIIQSKEECICKKCQYDCNIETKECMIGTLKRGTFTFDSFLDLLMPTKSLLIFIIFSVLVVVSVCMVCTMTCRFVDCFTDILCNKAKARQKKLEKEMRKNMKESAKQHALELSAL